MGRRRAKTVRTRIAVFLAALTVGALPAIPGAASAGHSSVAAPVDAVRQTFVLQPLFAASWWGGIYTVPTGERVRLYVADDYPADQAFINRWLAFLGDLTHGRELSRLTVYFGPPDVVETMCGRDAYACYLILDEAIVSNGESVADGPTAEQLFAHEYGHHLAKNRSNAPWPAVDWGTKRWASYERICPRRRAGEVVPGDEGSAYTLNPGEAFAETYRVLTDVQHGLSLRWDLVDQTFAPDPTALRLARLDALDPWSPTAQVIRGSLAQPGRTTVLRIATPRDGTLTLRLRLPRGTSVQIAMVPRLKLNSATICGERHATVRLTTRRGAGTFRLQVTKP